MITTAVADALDNAHPRCHPPHGPSAPARRSATARGGGDLLCLVLNSPNKSQTQLINANQRLRWFRYASYIKNLSCAFGRFLCEAELSTCLFISHGNDVEDAVPFAITVANKVAISFPDQISIKDAVSVA